ncbi:MAG: orotate phosphoribosyltransferase [Bacteroidales bacterium]|jgi:orotate phosphoribosyltransferase|nr:orotate phosphoribosyltransferase [Bacteroidales bacterium]
MKTIERLVAEKLMAIKAVKLQPSNPFTWASGWHSPIYCDNRKTLAYPEVRTIIKTGLVSTIQRMYGGKIDAIAGVATGAIAQGALVADALGVPFLYVRSAPKDHGMGNLIEGEVKEGWNVVVVEDLISTGMSSLKAVAALRDAKVNVLGMVAIFTYQFPQAQQAFADANVELTTLSNYSELVAEAAELNYIKADEIEVLKQWRANPSEWGK